MRRLMYRMLPAFMFMLLHVHAVRADDFNIKKLATLSTESCWSFQIARNPATHDLMMVAEGVNITVQPKGNRVYALFAKWTGKKYRPGKLMTLAESGTEMYPRVAFDVPTGRYLVIWVKPSGTGGTDTQLRGQFFSAAGTATGAEVALTPADAGLAVMNPVIISTDGAAEAPTAVDANHLVVWNQFSSGLVPLDHEIGLNARFFGASGQPAGEVMGYPALAAKNYTGPEPTQITLAGGRYFVSMLNTNNKTFVRSFSVVSLEADGKYRGLLDIHSGSFSYESMQALMLTTGDLLATFGTFSQSGEMTPYIRRFSDKKGLKAAAKPSLMPFSGGASRISQGRLADGRPVMVISNFASSFQIYLLDAKGKILADGGLRTPITYFFFEIRIVPHPDGNHLLLPSVASFPGEKLGVYIFTENIPQ